MDPDHHSGYTSTRARAIGAAVESTVLALLVCLATYCLRAADFAPLRDLVAAEDRLYAHLVPDLPDLAAGYHPILFVDIDDEAIRKWGLVKGAAGGTPRRMIAELTHILREAGAAVVLLDYDFRSPMPDDADLREELSRPSRTPVLLTTRFATARIQSCDDQPPEAAPAEIETVFDAVTYAHPVGLVHPVIQQGSFGFVEKVCTAYRTWVGQPQQLVNRPAAMFQAVRLANGNVAPPACPDGDNAACLVSIRWFIGKDTDILPDRSDRTAYARIKASLYLREGGHEGGIDRVGSIDVSHADLSAIGGAIAIVSSTHRWADDTHTTPVGDLPGALVHANIGLQLQARPMVEVPLVFQFGADVLLAILAGWLTHALCWKPIFRAEESRARSGAAKPSRFASTVVRFAREFAVVLAFVAAVFFGCDALLIFYGDCLAGWRFGILSAIVGAVAALFIESVNALAHAAAAYAESRQARAEAPAGGSPVEQPQRET